MNEGGSFMRVYTPYGARANQAVRPVNR
jgi:hypothetical protein